MKLMTTIRYIKIANNIAERSSHGQYTKIGRLRDNNTPKLKYYS